MKVIVKLLLAALVANAAWRLGSEYATHYRFTDSVRQAATQSDLSDSELRQRILDLAAKYAVPLTDDAVAVTRADRHTYVEGSYVKPIPLVPGYRRPWTFRLSVDGYVIEPPKLQ